MRLANIFFIFFILLLFNSCSPGKKIADSPEIKGLKFLSEYDIPFNKEFQNTIIGGLSGIDYDSRKDIYCIISDDRSERNPARFYTAQLTISNYKIDSVVFIGTTFLRNKANELYPGIDADPYHTPDPEALRYNHRSNTIMWSSEGERIVKQEKLVLEDPAVTEINVNGKFIDTLILPSQMHMSSAETGPRRNGVFEGVAFTDDYKSLFVSVEEPLYNDGSRAGLNDSTGIIRIIKFDVATKKPVAQYAYKIDPVTYAPTPPGSFIINGVSDILSLGKNKLLVVERSFSTGKQANTIKLYVTDLTSADNIQDIFSLKNNVGKRLAEKKLLLNLDSLGFYIDNIEGISFGPNLPNGHKTLVCISDNNFDHRQKTQVLLFEIE